MSGLCSTLLEVDNEFTLPSLTVVSKSNIFYVSWQGYSVELASFSWRCENLVQECDNFKLVAK